MQDHETGPATPEKKIAEQARNWRTFDQDAIANKTDRKKQQREYRARQNLRRVIDDAAEG